MLIADSLPDEQIDFTRYLAGLRDVHLDPDELLGFADATPRPAHKLFGQRPTPDARTLITKGIGAIPRFLNEPGTPPDPGEMAGIEAVIRLTERPALLVRDDSFPPPPARWSRLDNPYRPVVEAHLPQVGRIEISSDGSRTMAGTGFVVGEDLIMTNTHVIEMFAGMSPDGDAWSLHTGANPTIDFLGEHGNDARRTYRITAVVLGYDIHNAGQAVRPDMALLRVERTATEPAGAPLPEPATLASALQAAPDRRDLYLVGYPWTDNEAATPPEILKSIFDGVYKAKRLQPGEYGADFDAHFTFGHDCSTLGGNSGSGIVDLQTGHVIGLHYRGLYRRSNYALQLWRLKDLLAGWGLNFAS